MVNSQKHLIETDLFPDTLSVRNDLRSTKDETMKYKINSLEEDKSGDPKALEIKTLRRNSELYLGLKQTITMKRRLQGSMFISNIQKVFYSKKWIMNGALFFRRKIEGSSWHFYIDCESISLSKTT